MLTGKLILSGFSSPHVLRHSTHNAKVRPIPVLSNRLLNDLLSNREVRNPDLTQYEIWCTDDQSSAVETLLAIEVELGQDLILCCKISGGIPGNLLPHPWVKSWSLVQTSDFRAHADYFFPDMVYFSASESVSPILHLESQKSDLHS